MSDPHTIAAVVLLVAAVLGIGCCCIAWRRPPGRRSERWIGAADNQVTSVLDEAQTIKLVYAALGDFDDTGDMRQWLTYAERTTLPPRV